MRLGLTQLRMTALYELLRQSVSTVVRLPTNGILTENRRNKCAVVWQTHTHMPSSAAEA